MKLVLDQYADLNSPLHRWQQSYKLVGLLSLIFAFAFIQNVWLLPIMIVITGILFNLSAIPFAFLVKRLRYPGWFILAVVILLPFISGKTPVLQWGYLTINEEGCWQALLISVRFFCILTVSLVLFGTAPFLNSIKAMRSLGLPRVIVDMTLLSYRYLEELGGMLTTMQRAMKLRGFQPKGFNRRNLKVFAQLTGTILIRSYERSLRIYQAMILRGYGCQINSQKRPRKFKLSQSDRHSCLATIITITAAVLLVTLEAVLPSF
ncbi:cobalt ECF transporter T component CbiQ [Pleurocapsa sp. PCC 7319]|uniref:cobalt ECF transporter T component CbiQ n=1 Tax=Pleurocapsa sp. PCC 7319 TaxID=118161 RepID=UPI00034927CB|nr:cobalt ECF transporter T component CbiQ [Pleurocapsa sp. PCC 7319]